MKIEKAFCLFEQSGAFKHAFRAFGIPSEDWDIQNEYGETDRTIDLFDAIENAWNGKPSIFDEIGENDLAIAFFPCIYFCDASQLACTYDYVNYRGLDIRTMTERILERQRNREKFLAILEKMFCVFKERGLRLIFENPWTGVTFLKHNFVCPPPTNRHEPHASRRQLQKAYGILVCELRADARRDTPSSNKHKDY